MKRVSLLIIFLCVSLLFAFIQREAEAQDRTLSLGSTPNLGVTPLVALHQGLFQKNGLVDKYTRLARSPTSSQDLGIPLGHIKDALRQFEFAIVKGSIALPLVTEIGDWISRSQTDFKGKVPFAYSNSFDDRLLIQQADSTQGAGAALQEVSFCRLNSLYSAPLFIAESQNLFERHGLKASFTQATNGKICQDMLLAGRADYMTSGEAPFTYLAPSNPPIKILATLQEHPDTAIFARRDKDISKFEDLKGKRIGYLPGTVSYFFLVRAMKQQNINLSDLKLTAMQPPTMPTALVGGAIDAFSGWEPWGTQALLQAPDKIITLADPDMYRPQSILLGRTGSVESQPEVAVKILKALLDAQSFIESNNQEAFSILSKAISYEESAFKKLWPQFKHNVRLNNDIIRLLEDNFKILQSDDINFKDMPMPNFRSFIDPSFLKLVAPDRVGL